MHHVAKDQFQRLGGAKICAIDLKNLTGLQHDRNDLKKFWTDATNRNVSTDEMNKHNLKAVIQPEEFRYPNPT
jgi:hypothetical protein